MATDQEILVFFARFIEKELGIIYSETNYFQLEHRLTEIAKRLNLPSSFELYQKVQGGQLMDAEKAVILDIATNNETSFFRDPGTFKALAGFIVPEIQKDFNRSFIKIWSCASSSGQEPYSIAMELDVLTKAKPEMPSFRIQATDISESILQRAREALYSQLEVQRGLPAKLLIQYFDKEGDAAWRVKPEIRSKIEFDKLNLLAPFPASMGPFDIVFCRNVLIYQDVANKKKILQKIKELISPKGFLILGAAETLFGLSDDFNQLDFNGSVFYRLK